MSQKHCAKPDEIYLKSPRRLNSLTVGVEEVHLERCPKGYTY